MIILKLKSRFTCDHFPTGHCWRLCIIALLLCCKSFVYLCQPVTFHQEYLVLRSGIELTRYFEYSNRIKHDI